ncbi:hypothetical protein N7468_000501 [Penicillium chermesinum]|uniref:Uncharacterized protein n=1 Tax=Penicillium chermesinum TaxID=63820 RepID=A0A9W9TZE6_9EURO|nr:uncharacterized protein N7468_000501 [Penicillium chermesinum]KAJ5249050.1 hypothetical protein N7468_000501 [Penicillium chermesinum]
MASSSTDRHAEPRTPAAHLPSSQAPSSSLTSTLSTPYLTTTSQLEYPCPLFLLSHYSRGALFGDDLFNRIEASVRGTHWEDDNSWDGAVTRGNIFIESVHRDSGPHSSEIMQAIYQEYFPLCSLRSIFVLSVVNADTLEAISAVMRNGVVDRVVLRFGSTGYQRMLGTVLGRMVACFVLGAYRPRSRRISVIEIFRISYNAGENRTQTWNLRFELQESGEEDVREE